MKGYIVLLEEIPGYLDESMWREHFGKSGLLRETLVRTHSAREDKEVDIFQPIIEISCFFPLRNPYECSNLCLVLPTWCITLKLCLILGLRPGTACNSEQSQ